jgi:peptidoglycan-associated lipoprotein
MPTPRTSWRLLPATLALAALAAGCASGVNLNEPQVETRTPTPVAPPVATAPAAPAPARPAPAPQSSVATVDLAAQQAAAARAAAAALPSTRTVFFDFDSFVLRDDAKPVIDGFARAMTANRGQRLTIEGHTDERGSREYNLALGQRRADAVGRALALLGVPENQFEAVSFGEERPAAEGRDEDAWAKNRRAELKAR